MDNQFTILCYNTTEAVMHDLSNLPNLICVADHQHGGCPAGLQQIKTYSSSVDQDSANSQCEGWTTVRGLDFCFHSFF